jgi:uncharacterized membrane protein YgcG
VKRLPILPMLMLVLFMAATQVFAASDFGTPTPGQRVYDRAGVLTAAETQTLERRAADLTASGTPVVVYLRTQDATQTQTRNDASDLMDAWNVQSAPDARDGLVLFLNLRPDDPRHGQAALYAGRRYVDDGTLSDNVLQRIFERDMQPALADGRLADGIAAGLEASGHAIATGPPPPSPLQQTAANLSRVPLNIASTIVGLLLVLWAFAIWRGRPRASIPESPTTVLPEQLAPALAGALATGHVRDEQLEATILDLAARGALSIEPVTEKLLLVERKQIRIRLDKPSLASGPTEEAVWAGLQTEADADGFVQPKRIASVRRRWPAARKALTHDLEARGWFDPRVTAHRAPLFIGGAVAFALAVAGAIVALIGDEVIGVIGPLVLALAGIVALAFAAGYPSVTIEGANAGVAWRGYRAGLRQARNVSELPFDLGEALPYAVAMGARAQVDGHLKRASANGYAPAWFVCDSAAQPTGFYPYWVVLHSSLAPSTYGSSSSSFRFGRRRLRRRQLLATRRKCEVVLSLAHVPRHRSRVYHAAYRCPS